MPNLPTISVVRGTDFEIPLEFVDPSSGLAVSLVGCTIRMTAKKKYDNDPSDAAASFKKDVVAHTDALNGKTSVFGVPADTLSSNPGEYLYDLELTDAVGRIVSFGSGKFILEGEMTRRG
jgi:hypothetical protein